MSIAIAKPKRQRKVKADIVVDGSGSVYRLNATTKAGTAWLQDHIQAPDYMWAGPSIVHCEHGYVGNIIEGMRNDGLNVVKGDKIG